MNVMKEKFYIVEAYVCKLIWKETAYTAFQTYAVIDSRNLEKECTLSSGLENCAARGDE